jgi:hypothetical protein
MTERDIHVTSIHYAWIKYMLRWCDHGFPMCMHMMFLVTLMKLTIENIAI